MSALKSIKPKGESRAETGGLGKRRVLFIDSNRQKFAELVAAFEGTNIESEHVSDKQLIVSTALQYQPDLIIMNLFLNGSSTIANMRELHAHFSRQGTKIIVLTGHHSKENLAECIRSGASDFILEPLDSRLLLQRVRYQLQERETYSPDDLRAEPTQVLAGFQIVYDCLRVLAEVRDSHKAVFECLKRLADLSKSTRVNLVLADVALVNAVVIASSDDPLLQNHPIDLNKYPEVREVLINGSIVYIKDVAANPLTKDIQKTVKSIEIASLLIFPVRHRGETIGTLCVRLDKEGLSISDKHLKTFYMITLALGTKTAARKMLKKLDPPKL